MALDEYRRKRAANNTPEPFGGQELIGIGKGAVVRISSDANLGIPPRGITTFGGVSFNGGSLQITKSLSFNPARALISAGMVTCPFVVIRRRTSYSYIQKYCIFTSSPTRQSTRTAR